MTDRTTNPMSKVLNNLIDESESGAVKVQLHLADVGMVSGAVTRCSVAPSCFELLTVGQGTSGQMMFKMFIVPEAIKLVCVPAEDDASRILTPSSNIIPGIGPS